MRTESHLHSTDELADGRHHVIPCPVPGHEGERDSPGLDVRYSPEAAGRLPIGRQWLLRCWGDRCPYGSIVQALKTGTVLQNSNISLQKWAIGFYLFMTNLKGVSSMKLHRDLGITQKAAWHMAHRIRETLAVTGEKFAGPVEVDETYIGGKERNKHESKKLKAGRGTVGKTAVVGMKDRETGQITSQVVQRTDKATLQEFVTENTEPDTQVYTDEAAAYRGIPRPHEAVKHSVSEYVRGMAHTNGMESHWAALKRGYDGVYHQMSAKHLDRYATEFEGRHNRRPLDTADQLAIMAQSTVGKRLTYAALMRRWLRLCSRSRQTMNGSTSNLRRNTVAPTVGARSATPTLCTAMVGARTATPPSRFYKRLDI